MTSSNSTGRGKKKSPGICWGDKIHLPASRKPRVLILGDPLKSESKEMADKLLEHLEGRAKVVGVDLTRSLEPIEAKMDLVIVLGGDGAMLATSHRLGRKVVPVMGINIGRIGFLTAFSPERSLGALDNILAGEGRCEAHAMMRASVRRKKEIILDTLILNEVAVVRAWGASMVEIDLTVDRRPVCTYRSDGIIVSTATGSTAYSLSAGGPVLSPRLDAWVVTPIAPHSLNQRPVVLPGSRVAKLRIHSKCGFTADGHEELRLLPGDTIHVSPSKRKFHLVVEPEANFFARLRSKLHWGESPGSG
ncbi:MAG: NAD kinase [Planctomycetes bacterium]|nr:NAD kinase [Planctomycetota bacterium]